MSKYTPTIIFFIDTVRGERIYVLEYKLSCYELVDVYNLFSPTAN